jgi:peptidoglycan/xylan/chitin deacetylase (PgdA/CDA1 family)
VTRLKTAIQQALFVGRYYDLAAVIRGIPQDRLLIIMYHDIAADSLAEPGPGGWKGRLTRRHFEAQVRAFCKWYRVLTVGQAVSEMKQPGGLKKRTVAITFDDGYGSVYSNAFPILKQHGLSATVFPITDWIDGKMTLWWETMYDLIVNTRFTPALFEELQKIIGRNVRESTAPDFESLEGRKAVNRKVETFLRRASDGQRNQLISQFQTLLAPHAKISDPPPVSLTWDHIREMAAAGFEFGCHTRSHINLGSASREDAENELASSKSEIESKIGAPVSGLAYPYGSYEGGYGHIEPILQKLGFAWACTTFRGVNNHNTGSFELRRATLPSAASMSIIGRTLAVEFMDGHDG